MTSFPKGVWDQLKNKTIQDIASALERDGWEREIKSGATHPYRHSDGRRVVLHIHPKATKGPRTLKGLIDDIGWDESDLARLKLIMAPKGTRIPRDSGPRPKPTTTSP